MNKLNQLTELQAQLTVLNMDTANAKAVILAPVQPALEALNAAHVAKSETIEQAIAALTDEIKRDVLAHGESMKGEHLQAVFVKGRTTWDGKRLEGYAAAHTEILAFRTVGEPSVTIRGVRA
jgi:hypothetical protein